MFDSDKAATATQRMWLRMARGFDKHAAERLASGYVKPAINAARSAEACYWQATGEGSSVDLKDIVSGEI